MPELKKPDLALLNGIDRKPGSFGKSAANEAIVTHCSMMLTSWCRTIHAAIKHTRDVTSEVSRPYGQSCLHRSLSHKILHGREASHDIPSAFPSIDHMRPSKEDQNPHI